MRAFDYQDLVRCLSSILRCLFYHKNEIPKPNLKLHAQIHLQKWLIPNRKNENSQSSIKKTWIMDKRKFSITHKKIFKKSNIKKNNMMHKFLQSIWMLQLYIPSNLWQNSFWQYVAIIYNPSTFLNIYSVYKSKICSCNRIGYILMSCRAFDLFK